MSGGGRLSIDIGIESPKHRDSLGPDMNYYTHRNGYSQYAHPQWNTWCYMSGKQYIHSNGLKQSRSSTPADKANRAGWNHIVLGKDILVIYKT